MTRNEIAYIIEHLMENRHKKELSAFLGKRILEISDTVTQNYKHIREKDFASYDLEHTEKDGSKNSISSGKIGHWYSLYVLPNENSPTIPVDDDTWEIAKAVQQIIDIENKLERLLKNMTRGEIKKQLPLLKPFLPDPKNWDEFDEYRGMYNRIVDFLGPEAIG